MFRTCPITVFHLRRMINGAIEQSRWKDNNWALGAFLPHAQDGIAPHGSSTFPSLHNNMFSPLRPALLSPI